MRKMNEKAREYDYYMSGYALNSYQPYHDTIDIVGTIKKIVCIALAIGAVTLFVVSLIGTCWADSLGFETFLGFTAKQLGIGATIGLILSVFMIGLVHEYM